MQESSAAVGCGFGCGREHPPGLVANSRWLLADAHRAGSLHALTGSGLDSRLLSSASGDVLTAHERPAYAASVCRSLTCRLPVLRRLPPGVS